MKKTIKKPFYKKSWVWVVIGIIMAICISFFIPYGLQGWSIGEQLFFTAEHATDLYIHDEKDSWTDEEWNEYWEANPSYSNHNNPNIDYSRTNHIPRENEDDILDVLPPDYEKLWGIDFSDLEEIPDTRTDLTNSGHKYLPYIYREKSTGKTIVDVTRDDLILKLDPKKYNVEWYRHVRDITDFGHDNYYQELFNLDISKNINGHKCKINISNIGDETVQFNLRGIKKKRDRLNIPYEESDLIPMPVEGHSSYYWVSNFDYHGTYEKWHKLFAENIDPVTNNSYKIYVHPPKEECRGDDSLFIDLMDSIVFTPKELRGPVIEGDGGRFPMPMFWPHPKEKEFLNINIDEDSGKKIVKHSIYGVELHIDPKWKVFTDKRHVGSYTKNPDISIVKSRRCSATLRLDEDQKTNIDEWINNLVEYEHGLGYAYYRTYKLYPDLPFKAYDININSGSHDYEGQVKSSPQEIFRNIVFSSGNKILKLEMDVKKDFGYGNNVKWGDCNEFNEELIKSINLINE